MSSPDDTTHLTGQDFTPSNQFELSLSKWENYKIQSLLGEGGMARVYKAYDPKLNRHVALKFIRSDNDVLKKRLLREAKAQAQIEHDHVCKIYEVGVVDDKPYIAMQLIQGQTLQELVKEMSIEQKVL
ncbi:MAG TPA: protein kinase, partial [Acidobacteriota bacterium]|nr:protein kinase [Acidobacteriota bacterium]